MGLSQHPPPSRPTGSGTRRKRGTGSSREGVAPSGDCDALMNGQILTARRSRQRHSDRRCSDVSENYDRASADSRDS